MVLKEGPLLVWVWRWYSPSPQVEIPEILPMNDYILESFTKEYKMPSTVAVSQKEQWRRMVFPIMWCSLLSLNLPFPTL